MAWGVLFGERKTEANYFNVSVTGVGGCSILGKWVTIQYRRLGDSMAPAQKVSRWGASFSGETAVFRTNPF